MQGGWLGRLYAPTRRALHARARGGILAVQHRTRVSRRSGRLLELRMDRAGVLRACRWFRPQQ